MTPGFGKLSSLLLSMTAAVVLIVGCGDGERVAGMGTVAPLIGLNVSVVDQNGNPVSGFRWLLEEDTTIPVVPGALVTFSPGTSIHRSYSPVVAKGVSATSTALIPIPEDTRLMLSVLPIDAGYTMSGKSIAANQASVTVVVVHTQPIMTAQISINVFHDNKPLNNAPDVPTEEGLSGFAIIVHDDMGQVSQDAFGNMLGTTYQQNPDGTFVFDGDGNPVIDMMGTGIIRTDATGSAIIKYLAPGKYAVTAVPPAGEGWIQTSTLEGTPYIDAWVRSGGPPYLQEFGVFFWHAFFGFVKEVDFPTPAGTVGTITGQAVYLHEARPPIPRGIEPGQPVPNALIGLNNLSANDEQVYTRYTNADGTFTISNVPPGTYQLVIWDEALDVIIDFQTVIMPPEGGLIDVGKVPVFAWFGNLEGTVFFDHNMNGYPDASEMGMPDQMVNIRNSDGSIYQATATDANGSYSFPEVFPFFHWIVLEVDFTRYMPTGATFVIDDGGAVAVGKKNNPQLQPENGNQPWRTEIGPVLTEAMLLYGGQTNEAYWGKHTYMSNDNGGISGIVHYATTRAENDPRFAAADNWEPGIARVQVTLYQDSDYDLVIDDLDGNGQPTRADVDNHPFGWQGGGLKGPEDLDRNSNGTFDAGDAISIATSDSWDDNPPTGAVGPAQFVRGVQIQDGAETIRTWNQMRPGVFDGGYIFSSYVPGGIVSGNPEASPLPSGYYIVEAATPPGYEHVKEEDKNVDFGDQYEPAPLVNDPVLGPPLCAGDMHMVPAELTLYPGIPAPFAGEQRRLPDMKSIFLSEGGNAAVDFYMFTEVPKAAHVWGICLDDLKYEFDPNSLNYGMNYAPPWLPVAFRDFTGNEVARVYTDEWGRYNALVPSTFTTNIPSPTGVSPNVLTVCLNDPGPIPNPAIPGTFITDPWYNPSYGRVNLDFNFYPGKTTTLDTPVVPIAAFTANKSPLDCEFPDGTPVIKTVSGPSGGPYVAATGIQINITSVGAVTVPNPDFNPAIPGSLPTVDRDFGFGAVEGSVMIDGIPLESVIWAADGLTISAVIPGGTTTGQLMVTRGDNGKRTILGITLHVGGPQISEVVHVNPGQSIQQAIDTALDNALILVSPGTYKENLFLWKPVKLQGWGAYSTFLAAGPVDPVELAAWKAKLNTLVDAGAMDLIPGTREGLFLEQAPGIIIGRAQDAVFDSLNPALVDGITISDCATAGGIFINAHARFTRVSNNKIWHNQGNFGGGVRVGTPSLPNAAGTGYLSSDNLGVNIHHNQITANGAIDGGGGIAIFNGAHGYIVADNWICGNFTVQYGGGIAHFGFSTSGSIVNNWIFSNESFDEGGGIIVAGELSFARAEPGGELTPGSGSVLIASNHIQGNHAEDDGGGIRTLMPNGQDVVAYPTIPDLWHRIDIVGNYIVNNVSGDAGGGISLDDTANAYIINNTIARNDSTATAVDAFSATWVLNQPPGQWGPAGPTGLAAGVSVPQVAGIHSRAHSLGLQAAFGAGFEQTYSNPVLQDNIIWQNRSFYWDGTYNGTGGLRPDIAGGETAVYWDLAVVETPAIQLLHPMNCILTSTDLTYPDNSTSSYDASNMAADPQFVDPYFNNLIAGTSVDRLGNLVLVTFTPTGLVHDYHIGGGSPAKDLGAGLYLPMYWVLQTDRDGDIRPSGASVDAGADEIAP